MKTQFRIVNKGKGILRITHLNLNKVEQPLSEFDTLYVYINNQDQETLNNAISIITNQLAPINLNLLNLNLNVQDLDERLLDLEYPDAVLKSGNIAFTDLNISLLASLFAWRLNRVDFLYPNAFSTSLTATTVDYLRYDILVGRGDGLYEIKKGVEGLTSADIPTPDANTLLLAVLTIRGTEITEIIEEPAYDFLALEERVTELENKVTNSETKSGLLGQAYVIWSGSGLKYYVNYPAYILNSITYPKGTAEITLDSTSNITVGEQRYDLITLVNSGVSKVTGVPSTDPVLPTINLDSEISLTNILLDFGMSTPTGVARVQVYDENIEWVVTKNGSVFINPDYTTFKFKGTKSLQIVQLGSNTESIIFTSPIAESFLDYDTLTFRIYLPSNVNSGVDFALYFNNGNTVASNNVDVTNNKYDYFENKKDVWQLITIPLSNFQLYNKNFTQFVLIRYSKDRSFLLDDIAFVKRENTPYIVTTPATQRAIKTIITDNGIYNAPTPDALVTFHSINDGLEIEVENEVINFTPLFDSALQTGYDDLIATKETLGNKGVANGYTPLNEFVKIANDYLNIVNNLVDGGATAILSAEQGKQLQLQVTAIQGVLFSDNVNLDTVQEIVDAIENLQSYINTILVNDLTTGGIIKALTAEQGKVLKGLIDTLTTTVNNLPLGAKVPYTVYINTQSGSDTTGRIEDATKPFLTDAAAFAALPADDGNAWNFVFLCDNVTRILTTNTLTRRIKYICYNTGTFNFSSFTISLLYKELYFDMPLCTLYYTGATEYNAIDNAGRPWYINVDRLWIDCDYVLLSTTNLASKFIMNTYYQRNGNYGVFVGGFIRIGVHDSTAVVLSTNSSNFDIIIKELKLNNRECTFSISAGSFISNPIIKFSGTGTFITNGVINFDVTNLNTSAGTSIRLTAVTWVKGKTSSNFLGSIFCSQEDVSNFINYEGRFNATGDSYGASVNISNCNITLVGALIYSNSGFAWPARTSKIKNSTFLQDTPQPLFNNFNAGTNHTIEKYGTINTNGTIGDNDTNVVLIDKTNSIINTKVTKTYYVNSSIGSNVTGIVSDFSKPYLTIDYVLALSSFKSGDIIWLQNKNGVFPWNSQVPVNYDLTFKSDKVVTLDLSGNNNTRIAEGFSGQFSIITIDLPTGILKNERNNGSGVDLIEDNGRIAIYLNIAEVYWNTQAFMGTILNTKLKLTKLSISGSRPTYKLFNVMNGTAEIMWFVILSGRNAPVIAREVTVHYVSGDGGFYAESDVKYNVGDMNTSLSCFLEVGNGSVNFMSTVSTNDILVGGYIGNFNISGNIKSCPKFGVIDGIWANNTKSLKFLNFVADFGVGYFTSSECNISFENCSIKSTNSPIRLFDGTGKLTLKNSTFEVVNAVPLVTGGASSGKTIKIGGVSTNASVLSDQIGSGITINQFTNY
jgi:hypothetical protein